MMGCDIHIQAQRQDGDKWVEIRGKFGSEPYPSEVPFDWRSYGVFGFLANVRNYSDIPPLSEPRGLPEDIPNDYEARDAAGMDFGDHSFSWLSVKELADFDYDQPVEDRRVTIKTGPNSYNGGATAAPGGGKMMTYREFLGSNFMNDLAELQRIGAERIVFGFDS